MSDIEISVQDSNPKTVSISCGTTGAEVRYTTNGDTPTETSTLYQQPFTVDSPATIKAKAFKDGLLPSEEAVITITDETQGADEGETISFLFNESTVDPDLDAVTMESKYTFDATTYDDYDYYAKALRNDGTVIMDRTQLTSLLESGTLPFAYIDGFEGGQVACYLGDLSLLGIPTSANTVFLQAIFNDESYPYTVELEIIPKANTGEVLTWDITADNAENLQVAVKSTTSVITTETIQNYDYYATAVKEDGSSIVDRIKLYISIAGDNISMLTTSKGGVDGGLLFYLPAVIGSEGSPVSGNNSIIYVAYALHASVESPESLYPYTVTLEIIPNQGGAIEGETIVEEISQLPSSSLPTIVLYYATSLIFSKADCDDYDFFIKVENSSGEVLPETKLLDISSIMGSDMQIATYADSLDSSSITVQAMIGADYDSTPSGPFIPGAIAVIFSGDSFAVSSIYPITVTFRIVPKESGGGV